MKIAHSLLSQNCVTTGVNYLKSPAQNPCSCVMILFQTRTMQLEHKISHYIYSNELSSHFTSDMRTNGRVDTKYLWQLSCHFSFLPISFSCNTLMYFCSSQFNLSVGKRHETGLICFGYTYK